MVTTENGYCAGKLCRCVENLNKLCFCSGAMINTAILEHFQRVGGNSRTAPTVILYGRRHNLGNAFEVERLGGETAKWRRSLGTDCAIFSRDWQDADEGTRKQDARDQS